MPELLLDAAGRRRSPATLPDFHAKAAPVQRLRRRGTYWRRTTCRVLHLRC
jgi:hypothetical protein